MQEKPVNKSNTTNDQQFVDRIKVNDKDVLGTLYDNNFYLFRAYVLKNSGTDEDAKDVFQDAFLAFWRNVQLDKFTMLNSNTADRYLMKISKNKWIDFLRKNGKFNTVNLKEWENIEEIPLMLDEWEEEYINKVQVHFLKMGKLCRELLYRFYFKNEKLQQIAEAFSWKKNTVKNNKYRCLKKLRKAVLDNL